MRTRVSSCLFWRTISWAAAVGIRWVKPSRATVSPSWMKRSTASRSERSSAMSRISCGFHYAGCVGENGNGPTHASQSDNRHTVRLSNRLAPSHKARSRRRAPAARSDQRCINGTAACSARGWPRAAPAGNASPVPDARHVRHGCRRSARQAPGRRNP